MDKTSFDSATIVERVQVGVFENPPYDANRAKKYAMLKLDDCRINNRSKK